MKKFLVLNSASYRIDEIYQYTLNRWGEKKAGSYIKGLFDSFAGIGTHTVVSRPVPAEFGVDGFFYKYEKHFVYWKFLQNGTVGIVTVLHERMHQIARFQDDFTHPG